MGSKSFSSHILSNFCFKNISSTINMSVSTNIFFFEGQDSYESNFIYKTFGSFFILLPLQLTLNYCTFLTLKKNKKIQFILLWYKIIIVNKYILLKV